VRDSGNGDDDDFSTERRGGCRVEPATVSSVRARPDPRRRENTESGHPFSTQRATGSTDGDMIAVLEGFRQVVRAPRMARDLPPAP